MPGWAHDSFYQWGRGRAQTKTLPSAGDETPRRGQPRPEGAGVGGGSERCRRAAEGCWAGAPAEDAGVEGEGSPGVPHGLQDPQSACLPGPPHPVLCPRLRNPPEHGEGDRAVGGAHRGLRRVVPHPAHAHHHLRVRVEVLLPTGQGRGEGGGERRGRGAGGAGTSQEGADWGRVASLLPSRAAVGGGDPASFLPSFPVSSTCHSVVATTPPALVAAPWRLRGADGGGTGAGQGCQACLLLHGAGPAPPLTGAGRCAPSPLPS